MDEYTKGLEEEFVKAAAERVAPIQISRDKFHTQWVYDSCSKSNASLFSARVYAGKIGFAASSRKVKANKQAYSDTVYRDKMSFDRRMFGVGLTLTVIRRGPSEDLIRDLFNPESTLASSLGLKTRGTVKSVVEITLPAGNKLGLDPGLYTTATVSLLSRPEVVAVIKALNGMSLYGLKMVVMRQ